MRPALLCLALMAAPAPAQPDQPTEIVLPGARAHPESITHTANGTLYVGSAGAGGVWRIAPGKPPEAFVPPGGGGTANVFGVLADEARGRLWVCSNDWSARGAAVPGGATGHSTLTAFALRTGKAIERHALDPKAMCNDMAITRNGTLYVTDTQQPYIYAIRAGRPPETWLANPRLQPNGPGLDGIVVLPGGDLLVTTLGTAELLRIAVKDGRPGAITPVAPSQPIVFPDALRPAQDGSILLTEGGRLSRLTLSGNRAQVQVVRAGVDGTGVTAVGRTAWVSQGRIGEMMRPRADAPPFRLIPVPLD